MYRIKRDTPAILCTLWCRILRETSREAFKKPHETFNMLSEALSSIQNRIKQPVSNYTDKSVILKMKKTQSKLNNFFN